MFGKASLLILLVITSPHGSHPQVAPKKTLLIIDSQVKDPIGTTFLYILKEEISRSSRYTLDPTVDPTGAVVGVMVVSAVDARNPEVAAIAVSLVKSHIAAIGCFSPITTEVLLVGEQRVEQMAKAEMASIDDAIVSHNH